MMFVQVSAFIDRPPPDDPPPTTRYRVYGYVKDSDTNSRISGATVKVYRDSTYAGSTTTTSTGYFNKYIYLTSGPSNWKVVVTKSGYYSASKIMPRVSTTTYMGTVYMTEIPPPPPQPILYDIESSVTDSKVDVECSIDWGTSASPFTAHELKFYWSEDSTITEEDLAETYIWDTTHKSFVDYSLDQSDYENWYRITARSENSAGGWSTLASESGSVSYGVHPTDDTYTNQKYDTSNFDSTTTLSAGFVINDPNFHVNTWLKFSVDSTKVVKSATLLMYRYGTYNNGLGTLTASYTDTQWNEEGLTYSQESTLTPFTEISTQESVGNWDVWKITKAFSTNSIVSIRISCDELNYGGTYYSTFYSDETKWPRLVIEYWGDSAENSVCEFVDDAFDGQIESLWDISTTGNPDDWSVVPASAGATIRNCIRYADTSLQVTPITTGHYFEQDGFQVDGTFRYEAEMQALPTSFATLPSLQIGFRLKDVQGEYIAEAHYQGFGHWTSTDSYLLGLVDGTSTPFYVTSTEISIRFIIERDDSNLITVSWSAIPGEGSWVPPINVLQQGVDDRPVCSVEFWMTHYIPDGQTAGGFDMQFYSIKEVTRSIDMKTPHEDFSPFENPIRDSNFDGVVDNWRNLDGTIADYPFHDEPGSDTSWSIDVQDDEWAIYQELGEPEHFSLTAVENQNVGYTFLARFDSSSSEVQAILRYRETGTPDWTAVVGDWVTLLDDSKWKEVSVITDNPLPSSIDALQVVMCGRSIGPNDGFNCYVDEARLAVIMNYLVPMEIAGLGAISFNIGVLEARISGSAYALTVMPTLLVQGLSDNIKEIGFTVSVNDGTATIADQGIVEGNDKEYNVPPVRYELGETGHFLNGITKWGTRLVLLATGIGAPLSWILSEAVGYFVAQQISLYERAFSETATVNDDIDVHCVWDGSVNAATIALRMNWEISTPVPNPRMNVTFEVVWDTNLITRHTVSVTFPSALN